MVVGDIFGLKLNWLCWYSGMMRIEHKKYREHLKTLVVLFSYDMYVC